jgi:transcription elongation factor Elf1
VFEDFVFQLYSAAQRGRNDPAKLAALAPYLSPDVAAKLADRGATPSQVVIGTLRISSVKRRGKEPVDRIGVHIEATLISERPSYVVESWFFVRAVGVQSKPPVANRTWPCPNCGAAWQSDKHENTVELRKCQHCGEDMKIGKFDWCLNGINVQSTESALASLTGTVEEYGNDLETIVARDAMQNMQAITKDDPAVTWDAVKARFGLVYQRLNEGWNESDLKPVRGLTTRPLRGYLQYWLDEYRRQGLRNRLDKAAIENIKLAKIIRDKHFDAVTARVTAAGCDYTIDADKNLVGGSRTNPRRYTEYWTLIRSSTRRGPVTAEPKCPNCGAELSVSDAGDCTHCSVAIESGGFDWVLSKIEQDDSYAG